MKNNKTLRKSAAEKSKVYKYFADPSHDNFFNRKEIKLTAAGKTSLCFWEEMKGNNFLNTFKQMLKILGKVFKVKLPANSYPIKDYARFKAHYMEAVYGGGQELYNINQLNSSALIALMCFYNVSETNPITIELEDGHIGTFTSIILEKENPVYTANRPSSIDVALYGKDECNNDIVLFLESKFGEYFTRDDENYDCGKSYEKYYKKITAKQKELQKLLDIEYSANDSGSSVVSKNGQKHYCDGLKQIVSHYIGAVNSYELNVQKLKVYFGTILFDFSELVPDAKDDLVDYSSCYSDLAEILNSISKDEHRNIQVLKKIKTYQEVFTFAKKKGFKPDEDVMEFYRLCSTNIASSID